MIKIGQVMMKSRFYGFSANFWNIFGHFDGQKLFSAYGLLFVIYEAMQTISYRLLKYTVQ
jgi:hypothetical protein